MTLSLGLFMCPMMGASTLPGWVCECVVISKFKPSTKKKKKKKKKFDNSFLC